MANVINWFEIPAKNFDRACKFYSNVLDGTVQQMNTEGDMPSRMGFLPGTAPGSVGGAIVAGEGYEPNANGSIVYLNGGDDLTTSLNRVEPAGGKVIMPKTNIGENGFIAQFMDSEGNRVAFHSMS